MKARYLWLGLLSMAAVSCTESEISSSDELDFIPSEKSAYYALIDEQRPKDYETKTYTDDELRVLWKHDDRVTVFENVTFGKELYFTGRSGSTGGSFNYVESSDENPESDDLGGMKYAIYPHSTDTGINTDGEITYILPDTQYYLEDSFGEGANVMVAETEASSNILKFKNVGGYLSFKFYGQNVSVSSIILKSRDGEPLSGEGTIKMVDGLPEIVMTPGKSSDEVRLFCKDAVVLGNSEETATEFRFVLPPMTFSSKGFTITVATSDGRIFSQDGPMSFEVERNKVLRVAPLNVTPGSAANITIREISSNAGGYGVAGKLGANYTNKAVYDSDTETFTITLPTVTDFSAEVFNFTLARNGDVLLVDGEEVVSGVTPIDASGADGATLVVRRGNAEKRFTLKAKNTGLPVVRITMEGDGFTLAKLESYENSLQSTDKLDHRIWLPDTKDETQSDWSASVRIEYPDGSPGMEGRTLYEVETQVKGRGNYTWKWDKKPYALKFDNKKEVLGMPSHARWVLLANWRDRTLLRNDAAFWLSSKAAPEIPYTVRGQFVELEINGEHRGNYYLCEQIKINKSRVNITEIKSKDGVLNTETGGFLMEIDSYWDELNKFKSKEFNLKYMFKEPDDDPAEKPEFAAAYTWMENRINEFEKSLKTRSDVANKKYEDYLDVDSAIMFMLLNELTGNRDFFQNGGDEVFGPHSTYLYKDAGEDAKIYMGPIWDFDYETFIAQSYINQNSDNRNGWRGFTKTGYYYHFLCYNADFVARIKYLWNNKMSAFQGLPAYINLKADEISASQGYDEILWPYKTTQSERNDNHDYYENRKVVPYMDAIDRMITNFNARVTWMNTKVNGLTTTNPNFKY